LLDIHDVTIRPILVVYQLWCACAKTRSEHREWKSDQESVSESDHHQKL